MVKEGEKKIRLFNSQFLKDNKNKNFKLIFEDKEYDLIDEFDISDKNIKDFLEIKLKGDFTKISPKAMFFLCNCLYSLDGIQNWDATYFTDISQMFHNCRNLREIPDISKWDTKNVKDMNHLFDGCTLITSLPDISNWNTSKVKNMYFMFGNLTSLLYLPDISNWDLSSVDDMSYMFYKCTCINTLPDISKWNIKNVTNMPFLVIVILFVHFQIFLNGIAVKLNL